MFNSRESICKEFGLQTNLSKTRLRSELKKRMASIHADKTGGEFPNEAVKQVYLRMQEALDYLDNPVKTTALETRKPAGNALEARILALEALKRPDNPSYEDAAERTGEDAARRYRPSLIGSGVFAAVCGAILTFSQKLSENSVFAPIMTYYWVHLLIAAALIVAGLGFAYLRIMELRIKRTISALLSEDGIAWTVRECIYRYNEEPDCAITQRKVMDVLCKFGVKWHKSELLKRLREFFVATIPRSVAEKIAKLQISNLIERGVLRRYGVKGIEPLYVIDDSLAKEIIDDRGAIFFEHNLT